MKTIAQSLFIAICFGIVNFSTVQAEVNPGHRLAAVAVFQSSFYTTTGGKLNVALDKAQGGAVEVRLTNSDGQMLFSQRIGKQKQTARLRLDLSDLPDGNYQIAISNGVDTTTHDLTLSTQQPSVPGRMVAIN